MNLYKLVSWHEWPAQSICLQLGLTVQAQNSVSSTWPVNMMLGQLSAVTAPNWLYIQKQTREQN